MRATIAVRIPIPPMNGTGMRNPNSAREGIVWIASTSCSAARPARARLAHQMPSGMPRTTPMPTAMATIITCSAVARRTVAIMRTDSLRRRSAAPAVAVGNEFVRRRVADDPAGVEQHDSLGDPHRLRKIVRHEEDRDAAAKRAKRVLQLAPDDRIERAERFIAQENRRLRDHGPCDADALLLAAGERSRISSAEPLERHVQLAHDLFRRSERIAFGPFQESRHGRDIFEHRAMWKEAGTLDDVAGSAAKSDEIALGKRDSVDEHIAARGQRQPVDQTKSGRFPAPLRPMSATASPGAIRILMSWRIGSTETRAEFDRGRHAEILAGSERRAA